MSFSLIAAVGKNGELGLHGELIFHIKEDMQFFRDTTRGHKVVMGRKTWESLPAKLPNRENIVISRHEVENADQTIHDLDEFITENKDTDEEIFIIGGGQIYEDFAPYAKTIYLTEIDASAEADTYFPDFDKSRYDKTIIKKGESHDLIYAFAKYSLK